MTKLQVYVERLKDLFLFRDGGSIDNIIVPPSVTMGSIIWGILLRSAVIIVITSILVAVLHRGGFWWFGIFFFWFGAVYPAYRQWTNFHSRIKDLEEETICGKCRYFIPESQLCSITDEHTGINSIPCNGEYWEGKYE